MKKEKNPEEIEVNVKALIGGIVGGIIASFYTFGPLLMNLFGFDPVASLSIVKYWRYLIIVGVIVALTFSFSITKKSISLQENSKEFSVQKKFKKLFLVSKSGILTSVISFGLVFILGVYALTPGLAQITYGDTQQEIVNGDYKVLTLSIPGMVCSGCAASIQGALKNTDGIVDAKVTLSNKQGVVVYDPLITTKEKIVNLEIFTSIYPATIIREENWQGG